MILSARLVPLPAAPRLDPVLAGGALLTAALIAPTIGAMALSDAQHLGRSIWIKPLHFEASIAVYLGTLALFAGWLPERVRAARWWRAYTVAVVGAFAYEIVWIGGAAALGTASHFNVATPLWSALYAVAGVLAVLGTTASAVIAWHLPGDAAPGRHLRRWTAAGLWLTFALTLLVAGTLSGMGGHEVGGDGLDVGGRPFGWSRDGGDLRPAHFLATHAAQAVPLAALVLRSGPAMGLLAAGWIALTLGSFAEALAGRPFLSWLV